jgi:MFS family permease
MLARIRTALAQYPRPFWVLFLGTLISSSGGALVFPFLTIYFRQRFEMSMTAIGLYISANAFVGLLSGALGGSLADRFGRRNVMAVSLLLSAIVTLGWGLTTDLTLLLVLIVLSGLVGPLYGPASQAMVADLVEPEKRAEAYGLIRVIANLGVVIGPSIGGLLAARSYLILFVCAAAAEFIFFVITIAMLPETKPESTEETQAADGGMSYAPVFRDLPFLGMCTISIVAVLVYVQMNTTFPVYVKEQFGIPENQYGLLIALNALMVVTMQFAITRWANRFRRTSMLALSAALYAVGFGSLALARTLWQFAASVAVWTLGEMTMIPVRSALVADLAPETMRGRYMAVSGFAWGIGWMLGPLLAGLVSDSLGMVHVWTGSVILGALAAAGFLALGRMMPARANGLRRARSDPLLPQTENV